MRKKILIQIWLITITTGLSCNAQPIENNRAEIEKSQNKLSGPLNKFFAECLLERSCDDCIEDLIKHGQDEYSKYLIGGALYKIDADKSFDLHEQALKLKKKELNFNLEYAIELQRKGSYKDAIQYFLIYKNEKPTDYRIDVWLSECYINIGEIDKSIEHWKKANHPSNHTGIDKSLYTIHGRTDQVQKRSSLRDRIVLNDIKSAYELVFMDLNWELDWWNSNIQKYFLEKDLALIKKVFGKESEVFKDLKSYSEIKKLSEEFNNSGSIKTIFQKAKFIINGERLVAHGKVSSDLIRIALINGLVNEKDFFTSRGEELLKLADKEKDGELLNIYAYLESVVNGKVSVKTDRKGWEEYKDERFAISYFIGLGEQNKYNNADLEKALNDFPSSSKLQWIKFNCAVIENKEYKEDLIKLIKKEFKTLGSDRNNYSYGLKSFFHILENGI